MSKKKFTPEVVDEFLRRIAMDGRSARMVGKDDDMPSYEALYQLKNRDADVQRRFMLAMEARASALDDQIDETLDKVDTGELDYNQGRLRIDTIKWKMAKYYPRFYGDQSIKVDVEHKASFIDELKAVAQRVEAQKMLEVDVIDAEEVVINGAKDLQSYAPAPAEQTENKRSD